MKIEPGQVAVVTGGASGIGLALAQGFASRGVNVMIADVRPAALRSAEVTLSGLEGAVMTSVTDVADPAALDDLAALTLQEFGAVHIVCNNAGVVGPFAPVWEQELDAWRWILGVALMGVIHGIRSFVPILAAQGTGHVVNTASVGGLIPLPMLGPYNAAKHAVVGLSETLSQELHRSAPGVGVTVLCPGMVDTPLGATSSELQPPDATWRVGASDGTDAPARRADPVLSPAAVAAAALAAIEEGRLHVVVPPEAAVPVRARLDALLADL